MSTNLCKSPKKACHTACLECMEGSAQQVTACKSTSCPLYPYRLGHVPRGSLPGPATKAIKNYCLMCVGVREDVQTCTANGKNPGMGHDHYLCPLYPFRFGKNPFRGPRTDAQNDASKKLGQERTLNANNRED